MPHQGALVAVLSKHIHPDKEQEIRSKVKNKDDKNEDAQRFQARLLILNTQEEKTKEIELSPISYIPRFQTIA